MIVQSTRSALSTIKAHHENGKRNGHGHGASDVNGTYEETHSNNVHGNDQSDGDDDDVDVGADVDVVHQLEKAFNFIPLSGTPTQERRSTSTQTSPRSQPFFLHFFAPVVKAARRVFSGESDRTAVVVLSL